MRILMRGMLLLSGYDVYFDFLVGALIGVGLFI